MKKVLAVMVVSLITVSSFAAVTNDFVTVSVPVLPGAGSFVDVKASSMNFSSVQASYTNYRFASAASTCEFFAANGPWNIHVYSKNGTNSAGEALVLRNTNTPGTVNWMSLKFWQPNYGPMNYYTNPLYSERIPAMQMSCWTNMKWVVDQTQQDSTFASSASGDVSPIPFSFGIDAMGAATGLYSAPIYFELITP